VKIPALNALAPTQAEPPFAITQAAVLAIFVVITLIAVIKFRPPKVQMLQLVMSAFDPKRTLATAFYLHVIKSLRA
jgi:hypothetical protein